MKRRVHQLASSFLVFLSIYSSAAAATYTLTTHTNGDGSVVRNPGGSFLSNTVVALTATASPGWAFHHWNGDAAGDANPLEVTVNANRHITAVFLEPILISAQPQGGSVGIGSTFSLSVSASGGVPITHQWLFNGAVLPDVTGPTLTLTDVQPAQGGEYRVRLSNPYGSTTSLPAVVTVDCPGTNVVSVASDAALRTAIALGGTVRLCFSGVVTLTNSISIDRDVILDATGTSVRLSGGNAVRLFNVGTGISFTASNVVFADALQLGRSGADASGLVPAQDGEAGVGGAIYNAGGRVLLVSCVLSNNQAQGGRGGSGIPGLGSNGAGGDAAGGGIYNAGGTIILQRVAALNNRAIGGQGGTYFEPLSIPAPGAGGSASGGALYNEDGTTAVMEGVLLSNRVQAAAGPSSVEPMASGGGVYIRGGSGTFHNVLFSRNGSVGSSAEGLGSSAMNSPADAEGGAVVIALGGSGTFDHAQLLENWAYGGNSFRGSGLSMGNGGALANYGSIVLDYCSIRSNSAASGSLGAGALTARGGALLNFGTGVVRATTFDHNLVRGGDGGQWGSPFGWSSGQAFGGALFNGGLLALTNCTLTLNTAQGGGASFAHASANGFGGAIYNTGNVQAMNVTIASNAVISGTGFSPYADGGNVANTNGTFSLRGSILAGHQPAAGSNVWGLIEDAGFNLSSDGSAGFASGSSFNFTDPKLLPLANNGGPTLTMALAADSPALDWAPTTGAPAADQRGFARPFGPGVDLGAFEAGPSVPLLVSRLNGSQLDLSFLGQAGMGYRIERSTDLLTWELETAPSILATDGIILRKVPLSGSKQYFRLSMDF